jgi:hypothetical protein
VTRATAAKPTPEPPMELYAAADTAGSVTIEKRRLERDLVIELSVCRAHGRSLIGPPAEELIGPVEDEWVDALYKIAENVCRTRRRSRFRRGRYETAGDLLGLLEPAAAEPVRDERMDALPEILAGMPASQRRALLLREVQGLSYREIAEQLQTSVSAVETLLFRARRSFVRELERFARPAERAFSLGTLAVSLKSLVSRSLVASSGAKTAAVVGAAAVAGGVIAAAPTAVAGSSTSPLAPVHERSADAARVPPKLAATSGTNARGPHHSISGGFRAKARADLSTDASRPGGAAGNAPPPAGGDPVAPTSSPRPAVQQPTATTPPPPAPGHPEPPASVTAPSLPPLPVATPPPTVPALPPLPQLPPVPQLPPPPSVPLPSLP